MSSASSGAKPEAPVSVVLPCYNAQASVTRAVASIVEQSVRPIEIVAVDDGSTDSTVQVLQDLAAQHPSGWLKVVCSGTNRGPASARNAGWDAAASEWVAFLDADDTWHPRKLEIQLRALREHPDADLIAHHHDFAWQRHPEREDGPIAATVVTSGALLLRNRFVTPSVMVRRSLTERFRERQRHMEDHLLWMEMSFAGRRLIFLHLPLVTLHKPAFGASGLSGDLFAMEQAEIGNYRRLRRCGRISLGTLLLLCLWSGTKFLRRLAIVGLRRLRGGPSLS